MNPAVINFTIEQGADWQLPLRWTGAGLPVDLTGYTALMQFRPAVDDPKVLLELSTANGRILLGGQLGTIVPRLDAKTTRSLWWTEAVYGLRLIRSDGYVIAFAVGTAMVAREIAHEVLL